MTNNALIDTDILSYYFKGDPTVVKNFEAYLEESSSIEISIISYYEITSGLLAKNAMKQLEIFESFISDNFIVHLTERSCKISAELYSNLRQEGQPLDNIDLLIAGIAIENDMTLVTNNEKHFDRIARLNVENWKQYVL